MQKALKTKIASDFQALFTYFFTQRILLLFIDLIQRDVHAHKAGPVPKYQEADE